MTPRIRLALTLALALAPALPPPSAGAQRAGTSFDEPAPEYFDRSPLARWDLAAFGDLRIAHERTQDIPGRTVALSRARATARGGLAWTPDARFGGEVSLRAALGSVRDAEFPRIDNDAPDTLEIDRLSAWVAPWSGGTLRAGRMPMPLALTELVWDADLRPWGAAATQRIAVGALDVARLGAGLWRRADLEADGIVGVAQAGWSFREGAERSFEAVASWLWFEDTERLARGELGRQNRVLGAGADRRYAERFRLVDLQLEGRVAAGPVAVVAAADLLRNVEASEEGDALRTRLSAGRFGDRLGAEAGWAYLRAEREALPGAFASDDWWSRTRVRGHLPWVRLGWSRWLRLRVFGTFERRDGVPGRTERVATELTLRWSER